MILRELGLEGEDCHVINGHVPVKVAKGEKPIAAGGKLMIIDGGFSLSLIHIWLQSIHIATKSKT